MSSKITQDNMMMTVLSGEIRRGTVWPQQGPQGENHVLMIPRGTVINGLILKPVLITLFNIINKVFIVTANSSLTGDFHIIQIYELINYLYFTLILLNFSRILKQQTSKCPSVLFGKQSRYDLEKDISHLQTRISF